MVTLVDNGQTYIKYDNTDPRLGRHAWFDARSLAYMIENSWEEMTKAVANRTWFRRIPILDQGNLGSCTGNAGTGALGTEPFYDKVGDTLLTPNADVDESYAVKLYSDSTRVDGYPGVYPPDDTGSSGLAICKVLAKRGTITGYRWARTAYGFLRLLQSGPVLVGMPWYNAFFEPDPSGYIDAKSNWSGSGIAGGHELNFRELKLDAKDVYNSTLTFDNSWATSWGVSGQGRMRLRTYEALSGVDLKQFLK
jgi:hypothetical protein